VDERFDPCAVSGGTLAPDFGLPGFTIFQRLLAHALVTFERNNHWKECQEYENSQMLQI